MSQRFIAQLPAVRYPRNQQETFMKTPVSRRAFFWTLVAIYACVAGVVLFFAFGYRFSFERGIFIFGGSLTVKSNPQETLIAIDNTEINSLKNILNKSYHKGGYKPGDYLLHVTAPGFKEWNKKISVRSGISTEFWNVLLVRENYERGRVADEATEKYFLAPARKRVAFVEDLTAAPLAVTVSERKKNTDAKELLRFELAEHRFSADPRENIEWAVDARALIVPTENIAANHKEYFVVQTRRGETQKLSELAQTTDLRVVRWDPEKKDTLYYLTNGELIRMSLKRPEKREVILSEVVYYDFTDDGLYYLTTGGTVFRAPNKNRPSSAKQLTTQQPQPGTTITRLIAYDKDRVALFTDNNALYLFNKGEERDYFERLGTNIVGSHFSNDGKKLLFWSNNEMFATFTREWDTQPLRAEGDRISITRFSQPIKNVQWAKTFEHVIFTVGNEIKVIELDHRDHRNLETITALATDNSHVVSDFADDQLFFVDADGGANHLFTITFPEDEGFF